ncbi:MAG: hypothetical protein AB2L22_12885 [Syntrophales bacterium]
MSESTSYTTTAMVESSGATLRDALRSRGIEIRDESAWTTARERADQLREALGKEMEQRASAGCDMGEHTTTRAEAMLTAFLRVSAFQEVAVQTKGDILTEIRSSLRGAESLERMDDGAAKSLENRIELLASAVQEDLCRVEREVTTAAVARSMSDLGYIVEPRGGSLKGTRGRICLWAEVSPWGDLSLDYSGWSGLACLEEVRRVEARLAREGLILKKTAGHVHGDPKGGVLAQRLEPLFPEFRRTGLEKRPVTAQTITQKGGR